MSNLTNIFRRRNKLQVVRSLHRSQHAVECLCYLLQRVLWAAMQGLPTEWPKKAVPNWQCYN